MSDNDKRGTGDAPNTGVVVKTRPKTRKPAMYKVLMLNDDYTPMEFVVHVLERFFQKSREEATRIMLHVHRRGVGRLRRLYLRGRRDQGDAGDGPRPAEPASAAMHDREGMMPDGRSAGSATIPAGRTGDAGMASASLSSTRQARPPSGRETRGAVAG